MKVQALKAGQYLPLSHRLARCSNDEHVRYTLRAALLTHRGERAFSQDLGSTVRDLLFRPLTLATKADLRREITRAIEASEPRVELVDLEIAPDTSDRSRIMVALSYRLKDSMKLDRMNLLIAP